MKVAAVLLAGGAGTRFAGPDHKLLADFGGRPLWTWAVEAARAASLDEMVVVTGALSIDDIETVHNSRWHEGMATSLQAGIRWASERGCDVAVIGLADQPLVTADAWRAVAAAADTPIAVATYEGGRGHPVRLADEVWPLLPTTGDQGARTVMAARPDLVTEVPCTGSPADVDTVEDLSRWR